MTAEFHGTQAGQAARQWAKERLARGKSVGLSIGYRTVKAAKATGRGGSARGGGRP